MSHLVGKIAQMMAEEERKAWDSLGRYKFEMFGYHSSRWVMLNKLLEGPQPNPFKSLVSFARTREDLAERRT